MCQDFSPTALVRSRNSQHREESATQNDRGYTCAYGPFAQIGQARSRSCSPTALSRKQSSAEIEISPRFAMPQASCKPPCSVGLDVVAPVQTTSSERSWGSFSRSHYARAFAKMHDSGGSARGKGARFLAGKIKAPIEQKIKAKTKIQATTRNDCSKSRTSSYELALWTKNTNIMQRRASLLKERMEADLRFLSAAPTSSPSLGASPDCTLVRRSSNNLKDIDRYANEDCTRTWGIICLGLSIGVILLMVQAQGPHTELLSNNNDARPPTTPATPPTASPTAPAMYAGAPTTAPAAPTTASPTVPPAPPTASPAFKKNQGGKK